MTKDEALKMAIEAMTLPNNLSFLMAITACKEALEQPSVAELNDEYLRDTYVEGLSSAQDTHPAPSWQGLSDGELSELLVSKGETSIKYLDFARAIEQALKDKNS